jgi:O-antigen ligase
MINKLAALVLKIDFMKWAVTALLVLWASTTFSMALMQIMIVVAILLWSVSLVRSRSMKTEIRELFDQNGACPPVLWVPLALFFFWVLLSFFASEYPKESFRGVLKIAKPMLVFFMAADLFRDGSNRRKFDLAFLVTFLMVSVDSSIQYAFGKSILRGYPAQESGAGLRLVGPFGDFGKMGSYLILVIPVFALRFASEFKSASTRKKSFYALALALSAFILLYLTRCRGPVVALAVSFFALFLFKRWFKAIAVGVLLFLVMLAVTPKEMIFHLDADYKEQSIVERVELWKRALDVIDSKPWIGTGINTYDVAHEKYDTRQNWRVRGYYAHNGYLQLAAEIGVPGILFFLAFLVFFFRRGIQGARAVRGLPEEWTILGLMTGLLAFLIYALSDTNLQSPQPLMAFWFMAGVLMATQNKQLVFKAS